MDQMSIFDCFEFCQDEATELLNWSVKHGTGFARGHQRAIQIINSDLPRAEKVKRIKNEYGTGGRSATKTGYKFIMIGYDGSAYTITSQREDGQEKTRRYTWEQVTSAIEKNVNDGTYLYCDRCKKFIPDGSKIEDGLTVYYRRCRHSRPRFYYMNECNDFIEGVPDNEESQLLVFCLLQGMQRYDKAKERITNIINSDLSKHDKANAIYELYRDTEGAMIFNNATEEIVRRGLIEEGSKNFAMFYRIEGFQMQWSAPGGAWKDFKRLDYSWDEVVEYLERMIEDGRYTKE